MINLSRPRFRIRLIKAEIYIKYYRIVDFLNVPLDGVNQLAGRLFLRYFLVSLCTSCIILGIGRKNL